LEEWKNGILGAKNKKGSDHIFLVSANHINTGLIPPAQYSNTPLFQYPMALIYAKANLLQPDPEDWPFNSLKNIDWTASGYFRLTKLEPPNKN
jgi:hypothetical protein